MAAPIPRPRPRDDRYVLYTHTDPSVVPIRLFIVELRLVSVSRSSFKHR